MSSEDAELVGRALAGDRRAFGALVSLHRPLLVGFLGSLLGDAAEAEDVAQEACLAAFLSLERLRDHQRFSAWLTGIGLNLARMRLRMRHRRPSITWEDLDGGRAAPGFTWAQASPSAETVAEARQAHATVLRAIEALPPDLGHAVRQHYLEGLPVAEIAMLADVPAGTIKARLHRARSRLRLALAPTATQRSTMGADDKEAIMIEMMVQAVVQRTAPSDEGTPHTGQPHRVVLLQERGGQRVLPIWVGPTEGDLIALLLAGKAPQRPMTHELLLRVMDAGQMQLKQVAVTRLGDDEIFYAALGLEAAGGTQEVDARPSDALALALRAGAPIYVDAAVLDKAGTSQDDWAANLARQVDADDPAEWQTVSADDVLARWRWKPKREKDD